MTDQEYEIMREAAALATKCGDQIIQEASCSKTAIVASAIMLSTFCESSGTTEQEMIDVLKSVHKITKEFDGECK